MSAGRYNFTIEQGATVDFEIQWNDSNGEPIDLNYYTAEMQIRSGHGSSATLYATLSSSLDSDRTGLNLLGPNSDKPLTSGSIGLFISAASSSAFDFSEALYDLEMISGSGNNAYVTRLLEGKIKLRKNVTI